MSRLNYGHRAMLAVADLFKDEPVTMTTEGIEKRIRKHAHFAGHTLNPKTRFGEVEKAREQLFQAGIIESAGSAAFCLTDPGEQIVNAVKAIRTTPCMTTKQWDEHLKKQRDEVKRYVNLEKLPKVVQLCEGWRKDKEELEQLRSELEELHSELNARDQLLNLDPRRSEPRSVSPASNATFNTDLVLSVTPTGQHHDHSGAQSRGVSTPASTPIRRGLTASGSFALGLLTPGGPGPVGNDGMDVDDDILVLSTISAHSNPITPVVARSLSFGSPAAYPTPVSTTRPDTEAGPSSLPLEQSSLFASRTQRSAGVQAADNL
ncbi:hypothetical protein FA13DRAFT_178861 [Coprinellus micaceus]|uniref:Uncharacterized protein n=1 Tax=Coprinellus micaceus TaxID=71717 RepID=A0A4Y7TG85_COPMI|nr:hypothetical protein FA13DRAFT_178861 [Coprinellus micaceus]